MCMEDIKLGRESYSQIRRVRLVADASQEILRASNKRISFTIVTAGGVDLFFTPSGTTLSVDDGMCIPTEKCRDTFRVEDIGNVIYSAWNAICTGADMSIFVIDTQLEREK